MTHLAVALVAVASGILIGLAIAWGWRRYRLRRQRMALVARITSVSVDHVRDVLVPDGNGGVLHLDFVLLTPRGILVIDLRDVAGNVFGSDQMSDWTVMDGAQRFTFTNPQSALYDRVAAVRAIAGSVPVEGRTSWSPRRISARSNTSAGHSGASSGSTQRALVGFPFIGIALSHRDDAARIATRCPHDHDDPVVELADALITRLSIVDTVIFEGQRRSLEHSLRVCKIEPPIFEGQRTLFFIVLEFHVVDST